MIYYLHTQKINQVTHSSQLNQPKQPFVPFLAITHFAAILQVLKLRRDGPA
tara:strand:+ start:710 stop:862 length:153 start_codon:yes stop_codon:yes gene_type:complete